MLYARWLSLAASRPGFFSRSRRWTRLAFYRLLAIARNRRPAPAADDNPLRQRIVVKTAPWRMNAVAIGALSLAALLSAGGCGPSAGYVAADRATYDAIAPEYSAYVAADASLSPDQQQRRQHTLDAWKLRLDAAQSPAPMPAPATQPATTR